MSRWLIYLVTAWSCCALSASDALDHRLTAQWGKFDAARALALSHEVTRAEWEKTLTLSPPFSENELKQLKERQDALVEATRHADQARSSLDLNALRQGAPSRLRLFCGEFPKGGMLHVHAWGTLSKSALADLLRRIDPVIHPQDLVHELSPGTEPHTDLNTGRAILFPAELASVRQWGKRYGDSFRYHTMKSVDQARLRSFFFLEHGTYPFDRFEGVFTLLIRLILTQPGPSPEPLMYEDFFARAEAEKVSYVEMSAPVPHTTKAVAALESWATEIQKRHGITARMLDTFFRAAPAAELAKQAQALLALPTSPFLVGINLVNNEIGNPALEKGAPVYIPILRADEEHHASLFRTMHAGEMGDVRNVRDALILGAQRIGHGVLLRQDPVTMEYARLHRVPIETNLTSNVRLRTVPSYREHPFLYFLRLGMRVSLSTDDEGILGTDMNQECIQAISQTDLNYEELKQMTQNSLDTAFIPDSVKQPLLAELEAQLGAFEKKWKKLLH